MSPNLKFPSCLSITANPHNFLNYYPNKTCIPCYKEHDTSFIWYYYTYHILTAILDLDPDLCQNFLFFLTLLIFHVEACIIPLRKAEVKGLISFFLHLRALSY